MSYGVVRRSLLLVKMLNTYGILKQPLFLFSTNLKYLRHYGLANYYSYKIKL